jgi:hypothetical protein
MDPDFFYVQCFSKNLKLHAVKNNIIHKGLKNDIWSNIFKYKLVVFNKHFLIWQWPVCYISLKIINFFRPLHKTKHSLHRQTCRQQNHILCLSKKKATGKNH